MPHSWRMRAGQLVPSTVRIDRHDRLAGRRDVAARPVRHLEAATTKSADADVRLRTSSGGDPANPPRVRVANEFDTQARPMSEVGGVNDVDHRDDVSASSLPVQGDDGHQYPARQHDAEDAEDRLEKGVALDGRAAWHDGIRHRRWLAHPDGIDRERAADVSRAIRQAADLCRGVDRPPRLRETTWRRCRRNIRSGMRTRPARQPV